MKTRNILLPLLAVLLMSSCEETSSSPSLSENTSSEVSSELSQESSISSEIPQVNENVVFYQAEKISELTHMKALILDNITDETLKNSISNLFDNCETAINESNSVSEISELYKTCLTEVHNLIPTYDNTNESVQLNDEEKRLILDDPLFFIKGNQNNSKLFTSISLTNRLKMEEKSTQKPKQNQTEIRDNTIYNHERTYLRKLTRRLTRAEIKENNHFVKKRKSKIKNRINKQK